MTIEKIALIYKHNALLDDRNLQGFDAFMAANKLTRQAFTSYAELMDSSFKPDCVLVLNAQEPKLGPYPTYGIIDLSPDRVLSRKRLVRNLLTYDGYASLSPFTQKILRDLLFSTRKFGASIETFGLLPIGAPAKPVDFSQAQIAYLLSDEELTLFHLSLFKRLHNLKSLSLYHKQGKEPLTQHGGASLPVPSRWESIAQAYTQAGIGLDLYGCDAVFEQISFKLHEILASGALAITNRCDHLVNLFGDNILYLNPAHSAADCAEMVENHLEWVRANPRLASQKAAAAQSIHQKLFGHKTLLGHLQKLHDATLPKQGYVASSKEEVKNLPTISYIMRCGKNPPYIFEALDSLAAQSHPNIQVILVQWAPLEPLEQILKNYKGRLRFKVVESPSNLRSTGLVTGFKHVDTDYFGLLDDDDILHPNHVRSLINTLRHHNQPGNWKGEIKLAYCGNYYLSDNMAFSENEEWSDEYDDKIARKRLVENFQFFDSERMASHHWFMMSNAWLAHRSLIDEGLLNDPQTHSNEDIYFELQFLEKTFFAFSVEMTAAHRFHGGNATISTLARKEVDEFHHMLRLHYRSFPREKYYREEKQGFAKGISAIDMPIKKHQPTYLDPL